jgi:hypothetical protein
MTTNGNIETVIESGTEIFVPLNKLKKSPRNARKTPLSIGLQYWTPITPIRGSLQAGTQSERHAALRGGRLRRSAFCLSLLGRQWRGH